MSEVVALVVLAACLAAAVARPRWAPDWAVAAGGAVLLVVVGILSVHGARDALGQLGPTVGFLAALLVLADGCRRAGMFDALGAWMALGSRGRPRRLLAMVFLAAAGTTAVLSLDATVVLLTPIVFATAARLRTNARPHVYACYAPGQQRVAAAPGLEPDQPARVPRHRSVVRAVRRADGAALAGRARDRVARPAPLVRRRPAAVGASVDRGARAAGAPRRSRWRSWR